MNDNIIFSCILLNFITMVRTTLEKVSEYLYLNEQQNLFLIQNQMFVDRATAPDFGFCRFLKAKSKNNPNELNLTLFSSHQLLIMLFVLLISAFIYFFLIFRIFNVQIDRTIRYVGVTPIRFIYKVSNAHPIGLAGMPRCVSSWQHRSSWWLMQSLHGNYLKLISIDLRHPRN